MASTYHFKIFSVWCHNLHAQTNVITPETHRHALKQHFTYLVKLQTRLFKFRHIGFLSFKTSNEPNLRLHELRAFAIVTSRLKLVHFKLKSDFELTIRNVPKDVISKEGPQFSKTVQKCFSGLNNLVTA